LIFGGGASLPIPRPARLPSWPPEWSVEVQDVETTQTRLEPYFPAPPPDEMVASEDGLVCVPVPRGPGWVCERRRAEVSVGRVTFVKWRRERARELCFLAARDYEVPRAAVRRLEELAPSVLRYEDDPAYAAVSCRSSGFVEHRGHLAYEVVLGALRSVGARRPRRRVRRVDRVLTVGNHVLVLTAEGSSAELERHASELELFFAQTRFAELR
jgi:hypothetical protein